MADCGGWGRQTSDACDELWLRLNRTVLDGSGRLMFRAGLAGLSKLAWSWFSFRMVNIVATFGTTSVTGTRKLRKGNGIMWFKHKDNGLMQPHMGLYKGITKCGNMMVTHSISEFVTLGGVAAADVSHVNGPERSATTATSGLLMQTTWLGQNGPASVVASGPLMR